MTGARDYLEGAALLACAQAGLRGAALEAARDAVADGLEAMLPDLARSQATRLGREAAEEDLLARAAIAFRRTWWAERTAMRSAIGAALGGPFRANPRRVLRALGWVPARITLRGGLETGAAPGRLGLMGFAPGGFFVWDVRADVLVTEDARGLRPGPDGQVIVSASAGDFLREAARGVLCETPEACVASRAGWPGAPAGVGWARDGAAVQRALALLEGPADVRFVGDGAQMLADGFRVSAARRAAA